MLQVKLLEMPLTELEDSINAELDDNPALESENPDDMLNENVANDDSPADDEYDNSSDEDAYEAESEKEERKDELDQALESIGKDDQMPDYNTDRYNNQDSADYEEMVYGDTTSFYDKLKADQNDTAARHELFYPQIGVKPCSMAGGGVSKNIWNCFRTAPEGTGQPLTCSTSGMGLRLK